MNKQTYNKELNADGGRVMHTLEPENKGIIICTLIVLFCGLAKQHIYMESINAGQHAFITLVYIGVLSKWLISIRRRFIQRDMRRYLMLAAILMILFLVERFVKYEFMDGTNTFSRRLWYAYYISFIMVPLLMFMASLYMGKTNQDRIDRRWGLIFVPAVVVVVGIQTNDIHQLAFSFNPGMVNWNKEYSRGILYYLAVAILVMALFGMVAMVFRFAAKSYIIRHMWLTFVLIIPGILYATSYTLDDSIKTMIQQMYEFPEFICFFLVAFFESLVVTHLIPSNSGHETFFMVSSIRAGLTDENYEVRVKAEEWNTPKKSRIKRAEEWPVYVAEEKALLNCQPVSGGHFYWMEDVEELIRLNEKLAETGDYLEEERTMLDESVKLEENRRSTEEQNRLYDMVSKRLQPQLNSIADILENLPGDEERFRARMRYVGILGAYVKRRSNMLLLSGNNDMIDSGDIGL